MTNRLSIRTRIVLIFSIVWATLLFGIGLLAQNLNFATESQKLDAYLVADIEKTAISMNTFFSNPVYVKTKIVDLESKEFAQFITDYLKRRLNRPVPYKTSFGFFDREGKLLYVSNSAIPLPRVNSSQKSQDNETHISSEKIDNLYLRIGSAPLLQPGSDRVFGYIKIGCLENIVAINAESFGRSILVLLSVLFVLVTLATIPISGMILSPVNAMRKSAEAIFNSRRGGRIVEMPGNDEIAKTSVVFNQLLNKIEQDRRFQISMIEDLSHQLRTPISIMRGNFELGMSENLTLARSLRIFSETIEDLDRMSTLLKTILDLSKIESGNITLNLKTTNLVLFLSEVIDEFSPLLSLKKIAADLNYDKFEGEESVQQYEALIDRTMFHEALSNIVSNAIQYVPAIGGKINVMLKSIVASKLVTISISNNGPPIDENVRSRLFERFYSLNHHSEGAKKGFGLGLNISRSIIELHRGKIEIVAHPTLCEFLISIPWAH